MIMNKYIIIQFRKEYHEVLENYHDLSIFNHVINNTIKISTNAYFNDGIRINWAVNQFIERLSSKYGYASVIMRSNIYWSDSKTIDSIDITIEFADVNYLINTSYD